jgi:SET domain-containing protein
MEKKTLKVTKSKLPNAGKGLFTLIDVKKGEIVCEYEGELITWNEAINRNEKNIGKGAYFYFINNKNVIDAWAAKKTFGRYANDAAGLVKIPGLRNNATYFEKGKKVFIKATRNIKAGEEIFVSYGKSYWRIMEKELREAGIIK